MSSNKSDCTIATLQNVLAALPTLPGVSAARKRELESAIWVFSRALNRQPQDILARLDVVERFSHDLNAANMGISGGRLRNVKSLVRKALKLIGYSTVMKQLCMPLSYPWSACVDLFTDRRTRIALARLFRIFQLLEIAPANVSQAAFERVLAYLLSTGAARAHNSYRELVLAWNRLVALLH